MYFALVTGRIFNLSLVNMCEVEFGALEELRNSSAKSLPLDLQVMGISKGDSSNDEASSSVDSSHVSVNAPRKRKAKTTTIISLKLYNFRRKRETTLFRLTI